MDQKLKTAGTALLFVLGLYAATRSQYKIPDFSVFIPNHKLFNFSGDKGKDKKGIVQKIFDTISVELTTRPSLGFIISAKPIHGIQIPINMWLPWDFPIIYPQIKSQMEKNIQIEKKKIGTALLGYNVEVKNVSFYA